MNWLVIGGGGLGLSLVLPAVIQLIKPRWLKGKWAAWYVWAICVVVASIYLIATGQGPSIAGGSPAEVTIAILAFGSAVCALARQWYEAIEKVLKKIPNLAELFGNA